MSQIVLPKPYLLFLGATTESAYAKTAFGLKDWAPDDCVGEWALPGASVTTGLPRMGPTEAQARGAGAVLIGVASIGGALDAAWIGPLRDALEAGLDIVSGMHMRLRDTPELAETAKRLGRKLIDIRHPDLTPSVGTGRPRTGKRLLTVGTDCALGKKYTALALAGEIQALGYPTDFRATGQTGIMISGRGVPLDSVVADFISGAAESLSPDAAEGHWDVIEGQGSLFHPAYAGVTLGLVHGSQPDVLVLCHEPGRGHILGCPDYALPSLTVAAEAYLAAARLTNRSARLAGVSLNTSRLTPQEAERALADAEAEMGLPAADPIRRWGLDRLAKSCVGARG